MGDTGKIIASTYEILREIGSGGSGIVYLARHLRLDMLVVLKADKHGLSVKMEKLRREADALKSLSHTYIPQVYDFIVEEDRVYTVMSYVEGESFDKPLRRGERFPQAMVVKWLKQLLEAVCYLHGRPPYGILHSDIKPSNVMLTPSGDICLIDFNIALALGAEGAVAVGASRGYASPEHYGLESLAEATGQSVAPERWKTTPDPEKTEPMTGLLSTMLIGSGRSSREGGGILLDERSDIYSLGATIYHILSGQRPATKANEITSLSEAEYSAALVDIIKKAMAPDPTRRYQTAADMLAAVNGLHKNDPRYRSYIRSRNLFAALFCGLFLISGFGAFVGLRQMEQGKDALVQAEYSANALANGDTDAAIHYALAAMTMENNIFLPPSSPQALKALADATGAYDLADGYKAAGIIELPSPPFQTGVSPDGRFAAAMYSYKLLVCDMETGEKVVCLPVERSALSSFVFADGQTLIYAGDGGVTAYDLSVQRELWRGKTATGMVVSGNGKVVAAVNRDAEEVHLYSIDGKELESISFSKKRQRIPVDDSFANPQDNLFALNKKGSLLAVSFADGSLDVFDRMSGECVTIQPPSDAIRFEGGFYGDILAFSMINAAGKSVFACVDIPDGEQLQGIQTDIPFGVLTDDDGTYLSANNLIVKIDPQTGEQQEIAYTDAAVVTYAGGDNGWIVATESGAVELYDRNANRIAKYEIHPSCDFVDISGDFAVTGSRNSNVLHLFKRKEYSDYNLLDYDKTYPHDEARMSDRGDRFILYSYRGFRLYDEQGGVLTTVELPEPQRVRDQQYSAASGNLAVMYPDCLRIYSGATGSLLFEEDGLQSVFYAPYGISIFRRDGTLCLVDVDTASVLSQAVANGSFAASCGMTVDQEFLSGRELIGAGKADNGYLFAVSDEVQGEIYHSSGKALFSFEAQGKSEAFFIGDMVVISPRHGTPTAYRIPSGQKIKELEPDCYMTYATAINEYILSEYISTSGERFGLLMDNNCETIARLSGLCDIRGNQLLFDYRAGYLRGMRIHSTEELIAIAKAGVSE